MKYLEILRAKREAELERRAGLVTQMQQVLDGAAAESRSDLNDTENAAFEEARSGIAAIDEAIAPMDERIAELEAIEARTAAAGKVHVPRRENPLDVLEDRSATPGQLADALTRSIESRLEDADSMQRVRSMLRRHLTPDAKEPVKREWARQLIVRSTDVYASAWRKMMTGDYHSLDEEERAAIQVGSNTAGGYLVPTYLDPTIILTNAGTSNAVRGIPGVRVVELIGANTWNGVTSAGSTASWDGEVAEVSDDTPTFGRASIPTFKAQNFIQATVESFDDIAALTSDVSMLLADARDRLEGAAHCQGNGTSQPRGIFTALNANTNVQLVSVTAAAIGLVDIHGLYNAVPVRWRKKSTWLLAPVYNLAVKALGTALSASYSTNLTEAASDRYLNRPVVESDDAPTLQTTTAKDPEIALGDFSNYVIVDKPGSFAVEFIPQLFNVANNLPDGRKGWFAHWRNGADSVADAAFRLLVDKTSA